MTTRRLPGQGTIETLPSGRKRARATLADGVRHGVGTYDSDDEAEAMIAAVVERAEQEHLAPVGGVTVRALAKLYADDLELSRSYVAMPNVRSIIRTHVDEAWFSDWPVRRVTRDAIVAWVKKLARDGVSEAYQGQIIGQARKIFAFGIETKRLDQNPADGVEPLRGLVPTEDPWTYLVPEEQTAIGQCESLETFERSCLEFAIGTGLRAREQFCLHLADVHVGGPSPYIFVRYGSRWRAPKGRRTRRVDLLPHVSRVVERWLDELDRWCWPARNCRGYHGAPLLFPGRLGGVLDSDRFAAQKAGEEGELRRWLRLAGIARPVRWHDLRHTCAASLISGWWGRSWGLVEIRDYLGHASIDETERYAHLGPTAMKAAAAATPGPRPRVAHFHTQAHEMSGYGELPRHPPQAEYKVAESHGSAEAVDAAWTREQRAAVALLRAARDGVDCSSLVVELAAAVLGSPALSLASASLAGGPHALDRALELAALVVPGAVEELRRAADRA